MNPLFVKRPVTVPILARVTMDEREALKEVIYSEGYMSVSAWIRQQIVRKLKEASISGSAGDAHGMDKN
jgi:hypothetical protein